MRKHVSRTAMTIMVSVLLAASPAAYSYAATSGASSPPGSSSTTAPAAGSQILQPVPKYVGKAKSMGALDPGKQLSFTVYLHPANQSGLFSYVQETVNQKSPYYHKWLKPAQIRAQFGANPSAVAQLSNYLQSQGLQVGSLSTDGLSMSVSGSVQHIETAFSTQLTNFSKNHLSFFANSTPLMLPASVSGVALTVTGLDSYQKAVAPQGNAPILMHGRQRYTDPMKHIVRKNGSSYPSTVATRANAQAGSPAALNDVSTYSSLVSTTGTATLTYTVTDSTGAPVPGVAVQLSSSFGNPSLTGSTSAVIAAASTTGAAGAAVTATTDSSGTVSFTVSDATSEDINFTAAVPSAGLSASAPDNIWFFYANAFTATADTHTPVPAATGQDIRFNLSAFTDPATGQPVQGSMLVGMMPPSNYNPDPNMMAPYLPNYFQGVSGLPNQDYMTLWGPASGPVTIFQAGPNGNTLYEGVSASVSWAGPNVSNYPLDATAGNQLYGATGTVARAQAIGGMRIGIFAMSAYTPSDLQAYFGYNNLPMPNVVQVPVDGGVQNQIIPGWHGELMLDMERSASSAPGATLYLYQLNPYGDPLDALTAVAAQDQVQVYTSSFGMAEDALTPQYAQAWDIQSAAASAEGITLMASSGDSGANSDQSPNTQLLQTVNLPASDPYTTAVGGTQLGYSGTYNASAFNPTAPVAPGSLTDATSTPSLTSEWGWSPDGPWHTLISSSTGGYSEFFAKPPYQNGVVPGAMRGVPDISFMAVTPWWLTTDNGQWLLDGGTSAASPTWAGYVADMDTVLGGLMGTMNPLIYQMAQVNPNAFNNVTAGWNNGYQATGVGWNAVTGWGSVKIDQFLSDLQPQYNIAWGQNTTPASMSPGASQNVSVTLTNEGQTTWTAGQFFVAYRWINTQGQVVSTGPWASLASNVATGQSATVTDKVTAPTTPGSYVLQWDVVDNGVTWLSNAGAQTDDIQVSVGGKQGVVWGSTTTPATIATGGTVNAAVTLQNTGSDTLASPKYFLAYHWTTPQGQMVNFNGAWNAFPSGGIASGQTGSVPVSITAPSKPGNYVLQYDIVEPGVAWFSSEGIAVDSVPVTVAPSFSVSFASDQTPSTIISSLPTQSSIQITNTGSTTMTPNQYFVSYHWLNSQGQVVQFNNTWFPFVASPTGAVSLAPGQSMTVPVTISAPTTSQGYNMPPGQYQIVWDVIDSGVAWSSSNGQDKVDAVTVMQPPLAVKWLSSDTPSNMLAGQTANVNVALENFSPVTLQSPQYYLAGEWLNASGQVVQTTNWASINVASLGSATVPAQLTAPSAPGTYTFQWDIVEPGVTWLSQTGNPTVPITIVVQKSAPYGVSWGANTTPATMTHGQTGVSASVTLTNTGTNTWTNSGNNAYYLAYHWVNSQGQVVSWNGVWTPFPSSVQPGQTVTVNASINAPSAPGSYKLEWDIVQSGVTWFSVQGVQPDVIPVAVN